MNTEFILFHLQDAKEELDNLIEEMLKQSDYSEGSLSAAMQHIYHHINTAWNGRNSLPNEEETEEMFYKRRKFPSDIDL